MKQYVLKTLEVLRRLFRALADFTAWLVAYLGSVNIEQPRAVLLCVGLQLIVVMVFLVAFRPHPSSPAKPVQSTSPPTAAEPIGREIVDEDDF